MSQNQVSDVAISANTCRRFSIVVAPATIAAVIGAGVYSGNADFFVLAIVYSLTAACGLVAYLILPSTSCPIDSLENHHAR